MKSYSFWQHAGPDEPNYPWDAPLLHVENYPTPGMFIDLNDFGGWFDHHNGFDALVRGLLGSALLMAGLDPDIAEHKTSHARRLRQDVRRHLLLGHFNDDLYGCYNENYCCGNHPDKIGSQYQTIVDHVMGPQERGLNWMPRHAANLERLASGEPALRTTTLWGETVSGVRGAWRPLVWLPAFDLDALHDGAIGCLTWEDGVSTREPPKVVRDLGILTPVDLPGEEMQA